MAAGKSGSLGKNIAYMTVYHLFTAISPLIVTPYISRVLGASGIGRYSYAYSLAYYFVVVANLGITVHGSRRIAEARQDSERLNDQFSDLFWLHTFNSIIVTAAYIIAVIMGMNRADQALSVIMIFYVLSAVVDVKWVFYGLEKFKITVTRSIIIRTCYIILIFAFVKNKGDVGIYTFIMAFVAFFAAEASLLLLLPRYVKLKKPVLSSIRKEIKPVFILFIPSVANLLLRHFDKIMIGQMSTFEQLGYYENTDKIFMVLVTLITAVGDVLLPRISNLRATEETVKADRLFHNSLRIAIIVSAAFAFGLMSISKELVPVFFGKGFEGCVELLIWIAPSIIMLAFSASIRKQYLIPRYLERVYLTATISSLVINILANAVFIPRFDALGAVYGTLIAEMSVVTIQFLMIHKQLDYRPFAKDLIVSSMIGLMMLFIIRMISGLQINRLVLLIVEILTGAVIYTGVYAAYMKVTKDELMPMMVERLIRRK